MPNFKKYFIIPTEPEVLYQALTQEQTAALWTGAPAEINAEINGEFSLWDDAIVGQFLELEPNVKIVQEWYFGEENEEPSIVTIKFHEHKKGTSLEVNHTNIPDEAYMDIVEGWEDTYIASLVDFYSDEEE